MQDGFTYFDYYARTLTTVDTGIKLVVGGTGLGKTSSIIDVVKAHPDKKFIYVANRRRLLVEMERRARETLPEGSYFRVHRDVDQLRETLRSYSLAPLLETEYAALADQKSPAWLRRTQVKQALDRVRRISESEISRGDLYEVLESDARTVMRFFR
jgi:hypothetical protein